MIIMILLLSVRRKNENENQNIQTEHNIGWPESTKTIPRFFRYEITRAYLEQ